MYCYDGVDQSQRVPRSINIYQRMKDGLLRFKILFKKVDGRYGSYLAYTSLIFFHFIQSFSLLLCSQLCVSVVTAFL